MRELAARPARPATLVFAEEIPLFEKTAPWMAEARSGESPMQAGRVFRILLGKRTVGGLALLHGADGAVWIHVLSIDPAFRNRGIGRRALAWVESRHPEAPCFLLERPQATATGMRLYLRAGYAPCGTRKVGAKRGLTLIRLRKDNPAAVHPR